MSINRPLILAAVAALAVAATTSSLAAPPPPPPSAKAQGKLTIDSTLAELMGNPATRKVMDRHLPKLTENPHYPMIQDRSLRELAPMSGGKLNDEALAKIGAELAAAQ